MASKGLYVVLVARSLDQLTDLLQQIKEDGGNGMVAMCCITDRYRVNHQVLKHIVSLKGLFTNFEYITFFSYPTERNIFYKWFISIKPLWLEIIQKKGCTKLVRDICIYNIYNSTRSYWLCAPSFLNYFESEWFYRDELFIKNVSFGGARKKCYIFKIGEQSL